MGDGTGLALRAKGKDTKKNQDKSTNSPENVPRISMFGQKLETIDFHSFNHLSGIKYPVFPTILTLPQIFLVSYLSLHFWHSI